MNKSGNLEKVVSLKSKGSNLCKDSRGKKAVKEDEVVEAFIYTGAKIPKGTYEGGG